jgi:type II secretory pathway pseudopilin PulG
MKPKTLPYAAFTLVELLLVLALLVVIAGFTAAALEGSLLQSKLRKGVDQVRTAWSEARLQSVSGGQRLAFTCLVGGRDYRLSTCDDLVLATDAQTQQANSDTGQLPEGVVFRSVEAAPSTLANQGVATVLPTEGQWSAPIVFSPDGTSYDARLVFESSTGRQVQLSLRGLTCTAESSDVPTARELR